MHFLTDATHIVTPPKTQRVRKGGKATFECIPLFDRKMEMNSIEWRKDNTKIIEDDDDDKYEQY